MMSKKEEEKNEKIIRALRKLPHNRTCMNCNNLGPTYVCTTFWTFVCTTCSGIHREFTHRMKSVSMAKFTTQEVHALQNGGNQRARDMFLKDWDTERMNFPECSNADKIREFINNVYVHKKYAGERSSEKPPRDMEGTTSFASPEFEISRMESFRSASESFRSSSDSFTSARESFQSACSDSEMDVMITECENSTIPALSQSSNSMHAKNQNFDNEPFMQPTTAPLTCSVELFDHRPSCTTSSTNEGWATFDVHESVGGFSQTNSATVSTLPPENEAAKDIEKVLTSMHNSQLCSFQGSLSSKTFTSTSNQLNVRVQAEIFHVPKSRNPFDLPYDLDPKACNEADVVHAPMSTNPFDLPYDFDLEASNESFYANSSQVMMSSLDVPNFFGVQSQQWLPQSFIPQGGMPYMENHTPSSMSPNPFSEGYSAFRPGNPFAKRNFAVSYTH